MAMGRAVGGTHETALIVSGDLRQAARVLFHGACGLACERADGIAGISDLEKIVMQL
jgi:hypothetical protein